ncbi:MAG: hypothetical protein ABSA58_02575 [Acetobacteraceae bacterium]|jgi:hypothetical protein
MLLDTALAVLLVAVSGFIFGGGPEGANGETTAVLFWCCAFVGCFAAAIAGFVPRARGWAWLGVLIAFIPRIVAAFFFVV